MVHVDSLCVIPFKASEVIPVMVMSLWKERHLLSPFIIYIKYERITTVLRHGIHLLSCFDSPLTPSLSLVKAMLWFFALQWIVHSHWHRSMLSWWMASEGWNEYTRGHIKREEKTKLVEYIFQKDQSQRMFESNFISDAQTLFLQKIR